MLTLVLLPGMDGTGIFFEDFAAVAQPEFDPVIVRYPDDPSRGYAGLEPVARAALPRDKPFLILGESFSGPIAISIAASNPPGLVGLVLCVTFACSPHPLLPLTTAILKPFPPVRLPSFIQHRNLFGRYDSPRLRAKLRGVRAVVSQKTLKARLEAIASVDVSEQLRRVTVPTLDLRATDDRVVSCASGDHIRKVLPQVEIAELDAPHLMLQTVPHESLAAIRRFVVDKIKI
ncbi:MAG TPA: alpha/beta hydrolase [Candidatus Acidoferrum sp.]|jgi:pimeloyl-[acyl-carrier protein] methyl ester esterase|nr:alpha/beta hydrolase [Candidatus Acidoferrum sp.]